MNKSTMNIPILSDTDIEGGEKEESIGNIQNDFAYRNNVINASIKIRMAFIRKVYGLLSMQLLLTIAIAGTFYFTDSVKLYTINNGWPILTSFFASMGILILLHFQRRKHPINLLLLVCFTLLEGFTIGIVVSLYDAFVVLEALFMTFSAVIALTAFTFQTKRDFSAMETGLLSALFVLIIGCTLQFFIQNSIMELLLSVGSTMIFSLFIIFDTQVLIKTLSPEEYILATINLYLDIINLFLYILRILTILRK